MDRQTSFINKVLFLMLEISDYNRGIKKYLLKVVSFFSLRMFLYTSTLIFGPLSLSIVFV